MEVKKEKIIVNSCHTHTRKHTQKIKITKKNPKEKTIDTYYP